MTSTPPGKHRASGASSFRLGSAGRGGLSTTAKVGMFVGLVLVAAVAVFLVAGQDPDPAATSIPTEPASPSPSSRLACPLLQEAEVALDTGDEQAFRAAVEEAGRIARRTLQTSGEAFGVPERIAIELDSALQGQPDIEDLRPDLDRGLAACSG